MSAVLINFVIITKKRIAMYKIQANASGTRSVEISDNHLETIRKYSLLDALVDSNGFVDEPVLDKLKFHVRSLLENAVENDKNLLDPLPRRDLQQQYEGSRTAEPHCALPRVGCGSRRAERRRRSSGGERTVISLRAI